MYFPIYFNAKKVAYVYVPIAVVHLCTTDSISLYTNALLPSKSKKERKKRRGEEKEQKDKCWHLSLITARVPLPPPPPPEKEVG